MPSRKRTVQEVLNETESNEKYIDIPFKKRNKHFKRKEEQSISLECSRMQAEEESKNVSTTGVIKSGGELVSPLLLTREKVVVDEKTMLPEREDAWWDKVLGKTDLSHAVVRSVNSSTSTSLTPSVSKIGTEIL